MAAEAERRNTLPRSKELERQVLPEPVARGPVESRRTMGVAPVTAWTTSRRIVRWRRLGGIVGGDGDVTRPYGLD